MWVENLTVRNFDRDRPRRRERQPDLVERRRRLGQDRAARLVRPVPDGLRHRPDRRLRPVRLQLGQRARSSTSMPPGFNDSGLYIGACPDCNALVDDALMERNALGYSGTNSGGRLVVQELDLPQQQQRRRAELAQQRRPAAAAERSLRLGAPTARRRRPSRATRIARCTVFRNNLVENNNNLTAPVSGGERAPWGVGIEWPGNYADLVQNNTIRDNPTSGSSPSRTPNPFPPTRTRSTSSSRATGSPTTAHEQRDRPGGADIGAGGRHVRAPKRRSTTASRTTASPRRSRPNIEGTWGCQNTTTPNGGPALITKILALLDERNAANPVPQPKPGPQRTMRNPCRGVPNNPLCR